MTVMSKAYSDSDYNSDDKHISRIIKFNNQCNSMI